MKSNLPEQAFGIKNKYTLLDIVNRESYNKQKIH